MLPYTLDASIKDVIWFIWSRGPNEQSRRGPEILKNYMWKKIDPTTLKQVNVEVNGSRGPLGKKTFR